ncbi:MAG: RNA polymerase sigma factor [Candidatus Taylorbacteria bacterium]
MTIEDIAINIDLSGKDDEELAEQCRKLDEYAFQELTHRYIRPIFNFVRRYTQAEEVAEDIAQDTFFKVWRNIKQFKKGMKFRPWLYTIARNTALDHIKKKKAISFSELDDVENEMVFADTIEDTELSQSEQFDITVTTDILMKKVADLHPDHRAVITLHYQQELTFDKIAMIMKKPMNTVKSWHRRALIRLRELLKNEKSL